MDLPNSLSPVAIGFFRALWGLPTAVPRTLIGVIRPTVFKLAAFPGFRAGGDNYTICVPKWINKSTWKRVRLGEVAFRDAGKIEPDGTTVHRYVAADHIDEGDIHVRRWSDTTDPLFPPTFRFTFNAGNILLHSRNPKKVVIPRFDGITGEKLFVLKARNNKVMREDFLAFVLMSSHFSDWVSQWMSGSVNKFLNWSAFEKFEFDLPPLDQQRRIAEILWAVDEAEQEQLNLRASVTDVASARLSEVFADDRGTAPFKRVEEIAALEKNAIVDGPFGSNLKSIHYRTSGVPVIQSQFVTSGVFRAENYVYVTPEHFQSEVRSKTVPGDIIMAKIGENCGTCAILPDGHPTSIIAGNVLKITTNTEICLNRFLLYYFKHEYSLNRLIKVKNTTAQPAISLQQLKRLKFRLPPIEEQRRLLDDVEALESAGVAVAASSKALSTVRTELINSIT